MVELKINPHSILGLSPNATLEDAKRAWRLAAQKYHPDSPSGYGNEEKFKAVSSAWEILRRDFERSRPTKPPHPILTPADAQEGFLEISLSEAWSTVEPVVKTVSLRAKCETCLGRGKGEGRAGSWFTCSDCRGHGYFRVGETSLRLPVGFACTPISFRSPEGERIPLNVKITTEDSLGLLIDRQDLIASFHKRDIRGGKVVQTMPDGTKLGVRVPESYDGESNLRISNKGMPKRDGTRGDFILS